MAEPAPTPVTTPVEAFMVASNVLFTLHVPPAVASVTVKVLPVHTVAAPVITGSVLALIVIGNTALQLPMV